MVNVTSNHLLTIKHILGELVQNCEVRAFGSRVSGSSHAGSDLDLVIVGKELLGWKLMAKLKNAFAESSIPFEVDVLEWNTIPESFRDNIGKQYEVVQEGRGS